MRFTYRYLQCASLRTREFDDARAAFDVACDDLVNERTAPLDIVRGGEVVFSAIDIYGLCDQWVAWREGRGGHPLQAQRTSP